MVEVVLPPGYPGFWMGMKTIPSADLGNLLVALADAIPKATKWSCEKCGLGLDGPEGLIHGGRLRLENFRRHREF